MDRLMESMLSMLADIVENKRVEIEVFGKRERFSAGVARLLQLDSYLMGYAASPSVKKLLLSAEMSGLAKYACIDLLPMLHQASQKGERVDYNSIPSYVRLLDRVSGLYARDQFSAVMRFLEPGKRDRVLEIGCFTGRLSAMLAGHVKEAVGIDNSLPAIRIAETLGKGNCRFVHGMFPQDMKGEFDLAVWFGPLSGSMLESPSSRAIVGFRPLPGRPFGRKRAEKRGPLSGEEQQKYGIIPAGWRHEVYLDKTWPSLGPGYQPVVVVMEKL